MSRLYARVGAPGVVTSMQVTYRPLIGPARYDPAADLDEPDAWARGQLARRAARALFERETGARVEVGPAIVLEGGTARELTVEVALEPDPDGRAGRYIVALLDGEPATERRWRELAVVERLRSHALPFEIPEVHAGLVDGALRALVWRSVDGVALDPRAGRQPGAPPWDVIAAIAAPLHQLDGANWQDLVPGHATRREHARAALTVFDGAEDATLRAARAWAEAHLPPDAPSALLHGDLVGPNIVRATGGASHVTGWDYAQRGDPAHDLAIATRGSREPFSVLDGLERLLESYWRNGGAPAVTAAHVRVHELCLLVCDQRDATAAMSSSAGDYHLEKLRKLVRHLH